MFYILAWSCLKRGQRISVLFSPREKWSVQGCLFTRIFDDPGITTSSKICQKLVQVEKFLTMWLFRVVKNSCKKAPPKWRFSPSKGRPFDCFLTTFLVQIFVCTWATKCHYSRMFYKSSQTDQQLCNINRNNPVLAHQVSPTNWRGACHLRVWRTREAVAIRLPWPPSSRTTSSCRQTETDPTRRCSCCRRATHT